MKWIFRCLSLTILLLIATLIIASCTEEEKPLAVIVPTGAITAVTPPEGSEIPADQEITITFDNPVKDVTVNGTPATGSEKSWQWKGDLTGQTGINIAWTNEDGSTGEGMTIAYKIKPLDPYEVARLKMVEEQIKARGVKNEKVLKAMSTVPRHEFIPQNSINQAYEDHPLLIGFKRTTSQPYIIAYMTELVDPKENYKVLQMYTGSGYEAAVLAEIVDKVYSVEIIDELAEQTQERLERLGYKNIFINIDDGYKGWEEHAPYDAIILYAAVEHIPPPFIRQLKEGGKMCIPVGSPFFVQDLTLVEKKKDGEIVTTKILPVRFIPLLHKRQ